MLARTGLQGRRQGSRKDAKRASFAEDGELRRDVELIHGERALRAVASASLKFADTASLDQARYLSHDYSDGDAQLSGELARCAGGLSQVAENRDGLRAERPPGLRPTKCGRLHGRALVNRSRLASWQ